jgi:ribosomal protein L11 methyltransferase
VFIWRKRVDRAWLDREAEGLERRFPQSIALIRRPTARRTIIEICCASASQARALSRELGGAIDKLRPDWFKKFQKRAQAKPVRVGARLIVDRKPARGLKAKQTIVIPAEAAFGTGEHATTAMCLRMLERVTRKRTPGWTMLDAGTGSGILAIAGSCLGAGEVLAIDNDPTAVRIAKRNAHANRARNIQFEAGDVLKQKLRGKFDLITANLFSEILIAALPKWSRHLARGGSLIFSGVLRAEEKALLAALGENRFVPVEVRRRGKWIAVLARRGEEKG